MRALTSALFAIGLATLAFPALAASQSQQGPCQLAAAQSLASWPFEIQFVPSTPSWNADHSAVALLTMQNQYFSSKSSPFARNSIPTSLAFYTPRVSFKIAPYVTYAQTIDGRSCAQVVGARLVVANAGQIHLSRELAVRNCVSRTALNHQLKHHRATEMTIAAILKDSEEIKKMIFAVYAQQGAAGTSPEQIAKQLLTMELAATQEIARKTDTSIRINRKQHVETNDNFKELYNSCDGEFSKASKLAAKG